MELPKTGLILEFEFTDANGDTLSLEIGEDSYLEGESVIILSVYDWQKKLVGTLEFKSDGELRKIAEAMNLLMDTIDKEEL